MTNRPGPAKKTALYNCAKCDGKGRLDWTSRDNGVCYWCAGAGKVKAQAPDVIESACNSAKNCASIAACGVVTGREEYARAYARSAAVELHKVGTENARAVLADIAARATAFDLYEHARSDAHGRVELTAQEVATVRALIIEEGRKLAA